MAPIRCSSHHTLGIEPLISAPMPASLAGESEVINHDNTRCGGARCELFSPSPKHVYDLFPIEFCVIV
jgi:hypothetical protein